MSNRWCEMVEKFRKAFEKPVSNLLTDQEKLIVLRAKLIREEYEETDNALYALFSSLGEEENVISEHYARVAVLDGICDLIFVLIGTAQVLGMDLERAMEQVYWSNMSKLGEDGKPIYREDGKVLKGPNFAPPDLEDFV